MQHNSSHPQRKIFLSTIKLDAGATAASTCFSMQTLENTWLYFVVYS